MNTKPTIIFFGSFLQYSVQILEKLHQSGAIEIVGVVTTPPMPAGRKQELQKTHAHLYAEHHSLPVFTPEILDADTLAQISSSITTPDLFIVAGYGKLLPASWLTFPKIASLNVHFSLLPKYRGANPGEWAILMGETQSGVTLIEMSEKFDTGNIVSQAKTQITAEETRETLYQKLYNLGADLTVATLPHYLRYKKNLEQLGQLEIRNSDLFLPPLTQPKSDLYARRLTKDEAFIPWTIIQKALDGEKIESNTNTTPLLDEVVQRKKHQSSIIDHYSSVINSAIRALYGFPNVWTTVKTTKGEKRMKIFSAHIVGNKLFLDLVQIEGQQPTSFNQIKNQILSPEF